jgi:hypothetical protein
MRRLRSFLALDPMDRRLLARAGLLVAVVQLGLRRVPFTMLCRLATGGQRSIGMPADRARPSLDRIAWAVTVASRIIPGPTTCLTRALAAQALLARYGFPGRLHFGVTRGEGSQVKGHAWVESDGRILIGGTEDEIRRYTPLAAFDVAATFRPRALAALQGIR